METMARSTADTQQVIAIVYGRPFDELPRDLYIPPNALRIFLEAFEGPLDLLLYLIKKQNLDILNIPIAEITKQYLEYVELMQELNLELAAEYLVMASFLAEMKSRLLLPKPVHQEIEAVDPRAELVRKLKVYEQFKKAAESLDQLPRVKRDFFLVHPQLLAWEKSKPYPKIELPALLLAFSEVMGRVKLNYHHFIPREPLSIRERMADILNKLKPSGLVQFSDFFSSEEGRMGVVVTFIALLELTRQSLIEIVQSQPYAPIHIRGVIKQT
jgi:segregation and condensation protein A